MANRRQAFAFDRWLRIKLQIAPGALANKPFLIGGSQTHSPGTLIGKALEPLEKGSGKILVLLSLQ